MSRAAVVLGPFALGALCLGLLTGCHTPGGVVTRNVTVEFQTASSAAAQKVVIASCGHLPGVTNSPVAAGDPNVILDYSRANNRQEENLLDCLGGLQAKQPALQIRAIIPYDGTDT